MRYSKKLQPELYINGNICYVPQKPWIFNGSVRENIIFNLKYEKEKFDECIKYSCLEIDLKILAQGDQTIIG